MTASYQFRQQSFADPAWSERNADRHSADASYKKPFKLAGKDATFRLRYQFRQKDYSATDPAIGEKRQDKRHTARVGFEVPLTKKLEFGAEYKYVAAISNLPVADYTGNSVRASLSWSF